MNQWRETIALANQYFEQHEMDKAESVYLVAIDQAKILACNWVEPDTAVSALVISYQNLADLYVHKKQPFRAMSLLEEAHNLLQNNGIAHQSEQQSLTEMGFAFLKGARKIYMMLLSLLNELKVPQPGTSFIVQKNSLSPSTH